MAENLDSALFHSFISHVLGVHYILGIELGGRAREVKDKSFYSQGEGML